MSGKVTQDGVPIYSDDVLYEIATTIQNYTIEHVKMIYHDKILSRLSILDNMLDQQNLCYEQHKDLLEKSIGIESAIHEYITETIQQHIANMQTNLRGLNSIAIDRPCDVSTVEEIIQDLKILAKLFPVVEWTENNLMVSTDQIKLEGIDLGSFSIYLGKEIRDYIIIANQPATSYHGYFHPHIQGKVLCEGDATMPINNALAEGRLLDFFELVNAVLHTYNANSAYHNLDKWYGLECNFCGDFIEEGSITACEDCGRLMCEGCITFCGRCEYATCSDCLIQCTQCGVDLCRVCKTECSICEETICDSCLKECSACGENICDVCLQVCDVCSRIYCSDCIQTCDICEQQVCSNCFPCCQEEEDEE